MSDDLISRKAFMEYLGLEDTKENREENVGEIDNDKEKLLKERRKRYDNRKNKKGKKIC